MKSVVFALAVAAVAHAEHRGLPVLTVIPQSQHRGGSQTFDAAQDVRGVLYFGNLDGVRTYDGAWWQTVALPNNSAAFAVESDAAGLVAAGGVGELGYLVPGADGTLAYHSLVPALPPGARDVGEVRGICTSGRGFVFAAERQTIEWNGGTPRIVATHVNGDGPLRCGLIDGAIHLWGNDGLYRIERGSLVRAGLAGARIDAAVGVGGRIVAAVRDAGLHAVGGSAITPFGPEATAWLQDKEVADAVRLRDGRVAFATREDGVLLLRADGAIDQIIDESAGLPEDSLLCALTDREGALWLAYHGPLVRVDLASPVTSLDRRRGLKGAARSITAHQGKLWVTTSLGLYVFVSEDRDAIRISSIPSPAWWTLPVDDDLLVSTGDGIFLMKNGAAPVRIEGTRGLAVYQLLRSTTDPARVFMAGRHALSTLQRDGSGWRYAGAIAGTPRYVRNILEHDGVLWAGTVFDGILRVDGDGTIARFGKGEIDAAVIGGRVVFCTPPGHVLHLRADGTLDPDPLLGHIPDTPTFFQIAEDRSGNVWVNSDPPRMYAREGRGYAREPRLLSGVGTDIQMLRYEDGAMWFGSVEGLFRYAPTPVEQRAAQPPPMIRRVVAGTGGDTLLSEGISTVSNATALRYAFRRLRIEFAPASYRPGITYQYRLDPIDSAWSEWTSNPFIDYTRLDEGRYTFRVRARGATGVTSDDAQWSFSVHPPWYRAPWAMLLGLLAAAALVALIVKLRTRALRRQAARLQALVEERTRELAKTVDLLEQANDHLEHLSLLDELTGIPNRRYFDRALAQALDAAAQMNQPLSLILLDLDHFKLLNDNRGHPAGDASLIQVARLLARKIRRSGEMVLRGGDIVARIGGEEFAILLTNTDVETAARIAETLREAVAELIIAWESAMLRITVSCGVASTAHATSTSAEALVRRADRALYAAKAAGRNCVRTAA